ncbi:hypothetical protein [Mangrovitalea sediminis]|uniref:hypothetical protein n=1 Tax=Mangrovitalea sediminis TaxID=1982043 RepID=UPI0011784473|nr:hypothetical protein [Mangrovitalea sediminis]
MALLASVTALAKPLDRHIRFEGRALDANSQTLLYTEDHRITGICENNHWQPLHENVTYRAPNGQILATKQLDYGSGLQTPSFTLHDDVFGERFDVRYQKGQPVSVRWRDTHGKEHQSDVSPTPALVIDGGFDYKVKADWSKLMAGETLHFDFLAPTRGKTIAFRLVPANRTEREKTGAAHSFVIKPESTILSWFVDPILLGYNQQRQLTDYIGLTNIPKTADTNYRAHIHYQHPPIPDCAKANPD